MAGSDGPGSPERPGGPLGASCRYRWLVLYRATELIAYPLLRAYFRPEVHGVEHVPRTGAAILAANHLSAADEVFTPVAARRQVVYFAKSEYFTQPGLEGAVRGPGVQGVRSRARRPRRRRAAASTIRIGAELLGQGSALGIYPEGPARPTDGCTGSAPGWRAWR